MGGADPEVDGALWDQAVTLRSDDGEFANAKNERSNLRCSRVEMHTLKSDERMDWSAVDIWMRDVELDDFIAKSEQPTRTQVASIPSLIHVSCTE